MRKSIFLVPLLTVASITAYAQNITVKGKVVSAKDKQPLPGVTVIDKATKKGAITTPDGLFQIEVDKNATLSFSLIGYGSKDVPVNGNASLNIELAESTQGLDEVVVMGYTSTTVRNQTGAAQTIKEKEIKDVTASSVDKMLQGKASGVFIGSSSGNPNEPPTIRIRGNGTLTAGTSPLLVVDGVISNYYPNPSDIENVTVLKDAASTSLYGARAANGVLVITTKRGKAGKTKITARGNLGVNKLNMGRFGLMDTQGLYDLQYKSAQELYANDPDKFQKFITESLPPEILNTNTDWTDVGFQTGTNQNYEVNISGGNEKTRFFLVGNYYNEEGILKGVGLERYSARLNLDHQVSDKFKVGVNLSGIMANETDNSLGSIYPMFLNLPWDKPYNDDGTPLDPRVSKWYGRDPSNFVYDQQFSNNKTRKQTFDALVKLEYQFTDWLSFSSTNRAQYNNFRNQDNTDYRTASGADLQGLLSNEYRYTQTYLSSNLLKAQRNFGKHHVDGLIGAEFQTYNYDNMEGTGKGIIAGGVLNNTSAPNSLGGTKIDRAFNSYFVNANYNYDYRYYVTTSFRRDGSSRFGFNNQYGNFYALGFTWAASNEEFLKYNEVISNLKLRTSLGTTGNAEITDYIAYPSYAINAQYNGSPAGYPSIIGNPNLSWEKAMNYNVGVDVGFLNNRFNLTVDVYQRDNKDLLYNVPLNVATGYYNMIQNIGAVRNRGIEIGISTDNLGPNSQVTWTTDFNIAFNNNRIQSLNDGVGQVVDPSNGSFVLAIGHDMRTYYMRKWAGVDPENGDPLWEKVSTDADGKKVVTTTNSYNQATIQMVGSSTPKFFGGMRNTVSYKGVQLSAFFNFVSGNKVYNNQRELFDNDGFYAQYNIMKLDDNWSRWEKPGDNATHPKYVLNGNKNSNKPSSRFIEDGSYLRLRNVTLSYDLPKTWLQSLKVEGVRVSFSGDNLWTLTKFSGIDPDADDRAVMGFKYPFATRWLAGLEINF
ncbi:SusC/RagA family TonB-linked outer membrane protein [Chitinophaga caeni]|uniref:SusC/RagA family TonB-linked outer membrane protein n=1 Tax=Chitinophaga caeni TaxID=2029983 RepID=A0A291QRZ3_9BACT|nr:TonB-dependent receptor [Chitinophaga caeni]ATL46730.1 SusC/RagA family TonB-linked outer membrane protein [Chitinophaga caeni]